MAWLAATEARRGSPLALWPEARSAIVLAINYGPNGDPLECLEQRGTGILDLDALLAYIKHLGQVTPPADQRLRAADGR